MLCFVDFMYIESTRCVNSAFIDIICLIYVDNLYIWCASSFACAVNLVGFYERYTSHLGLTDSGYDPLHGLHLTVIFALHKSLM